MFKYTAHPDVLRKYANIEKRAKRPWDDHYFLALSITGSASAYFACGDFWRHYNACEFYSPTKREKIPLNGVLVSVEWFTETVL
jgi:hypothetical protein